ncbi:MAG TPA: hypothetical protein PLN63_05720 [Paludibacteraceae bacterium]|nr:hypothetical protein [Paludibacteraceae bacterium]HOU68737.1 hypothetical protein [Paludibacteraceae bacterium]HPH63098.1 hypothetical protein [Paludibacteraceae bacterium]HQF50525.1 hypothetical protein [Paludibacteraceae bacterium]
MDFRKRNRIRPLPNQHIENLKYLAQEVNAGTVFESVYFKQTADLIDNEKVFKEDGTPDTINNKQWTSIGHYIDNSKNPFNGFYDGNGFEFLAYTSTAKKMV